jgi:hypothetical protein
MDSAKLGEGGGVLFRHTHTLHQPPLLAAIKFSKYT